ncbi:MAG: hypothetical protein IT535_08485 [Bauldia sp.]|nr:hypothetical protein [Bauldia sp.]
MRFRPVRFLVRSVAVLVGASLILAAAGFTFLANAQAIFPYSVEYGRLSLSSDRPFDPEAGRALLAEIERRISASPLDVPERTHRIIVANDDWGRRITFLWNYGAGGVNYYPVRNVFLRQSDIDAGLMLRGDGSAVPPPRTLAYYGAHEIGHSLIAEHVGAIANHQLPAWIREGLADYIAFGGEVDVAALGEALLARDRDLDPQESGTYALYRLLVAYFLDYEGWTIDELLSSGLSREEAEAEIFAFLQSS